MRVGRVIDPGDGARLDDCLLLVMPGPASYTGEDVAEFQCHGSPMLVERLISCCTAYGARRAAPGEFTRRAYLAGKIDLTQAEAVADLVSAETDLALRVAAAQSQGLLGRRLAAAASGLVAVASSVEATIDFPEDDCPEPQRSELSAALARVREDLVSLGSTARLGRTIAHGAAVVITGRANAGKSSLFNALLGTTRAIVDPEPGTTRDVVEARLDLDGLPVRLLDTAGLRTDPGAIERAGLELAAEARRGADLVLLVVDLSEAEPLADIAYAADADSADVLVVGNKLDLAPAAARAGRLPPMQAEGKAADPAICVSALTGQGIAELRGALRERLVGGGTWQQGMALISTERQEREVRAAVAGIDAASAAMDKGMPLDVCMIGVYAALDALARASGRGIGAVREDVLAEVFSRFCVGK